MKFVHDQFRQFENNEADRDWFVHRHLFTGSTHHREIFVNYLGLSERGLTHRFCQLLWIADETHVYSIFDLFHSLAESGVRL